MQVITENKVVPNLRFRQFGGEWKFLESQNLFPNIRNGFVGVVKSFYTEKGVKYLNGMNVKHNRFIKKGLINVTLDFHEKHSKSKLNINDIVMVQSGHVGECAVINEEYNDANCHALLIMTPNELSYSYFYSYYFYSPGGRKKIHFITTGNTIQHILGSDLKKIKIPHPSLPEQQKIASFLSAVDKKLQQLTKKKDLLEEYKKGVMQQIFAQELRFKDDNVNNYTDWEEKKLGEFSVNYHQGINTAADRVVYQQNGYPILQAKHITDEVIDFTDARFLSKLDYDNYSTKYKPKLNDILISNIGTIGKIVQVEEDLEYLVAWNIFKVTLNQELCYPKFILYVLRDVSRRGYFERVKTGNATKFVNKVDMLSVKVSLPSLDEQQKISNFLTSLDSKIDSVSNQIKNTKAFKKGLLQQMFV